MSRPPNFPDDTAILHLYAQFTYHGPAEILGTPMGLAALRDAITLALDTGKGEAEVMCNDGEGYGITVRRTNTTGMGYAAMPYLADFARAEREDFAEDRSAALEAAQSAGAAAPVNSLDWSMWSPPGGRG